MYEKTNFGNSLHSGQGNRNSMDLINDFNNIYASGKINITDYSVSADSFSTIRVNTISSRKLEIEIHSIVERKFTR